MEASLRDLHEERDSLRNEIELLASGGHRRHWRGCRYWWGHHRYWRGHCSHWWVEIRTQLLVAKDFAVAEKKLHLTISGRHSEQQPQDEPVSEQQPQDEPVPEQQQDAPTTKQQDKASTIM